MSKTSWLRAARVACAGLGFLLAGAACASAAVKLPPVFGSHMVLQRDRPVPVWGWDDPGKTVTVTIGTTETNTKTDAQGKWQVMLPAMTAGGPHKLTVSGTTTATFDDVLVGEVWLCSGQSNMEWSVKQSADPDKEIAAANHPRIRHIKIGRAPSATPQTDVASSGWQVCSPETAAAFTAVGYFFGRELQKDLDVPIGLIGSNWGGTRIEPWTPPEGFKSVPALKDIADKLADFPAKGANGAINHQSPLALYNGMIHPLVPYGIKGAIWYQGESNNGEGMLYYEKMKALIQGWRKVWGQDDLPFYFVQLAPYNYGGPANSGKLPGIWEAQIAALSIPHTGMAATVDIGNPKDIHPKNKQDVGKRLALAALTHTYGKTGLVWSGPLYKGSKVEGNKVRVSFEHASGGLVSRDGKPLSWFQVAGEDGTYVEAQAEIDGETVVVSAASVAKPVAVRFAWDHVAEPNLSNQAGLPASPFRSDKTK